MWFLGLFPTSSVPRRGVVRSGGVAGKLAYQDALTIWNTVALGYRRCWGLSMFLF